MWNFLYQLSSPKQFYKLTQRWLPWIGSLAFVVMALGMVWGLGFAPEDYQQGDAFRIIYVHVPCAVMSMGLYAWMGFLAVLVLVWRIKMAGLILEVIAPLGGLTTLLALITGSLWGKPMWGAWWVWDARLTSELILFFLYAAIIAISQSYNNKDQSDKIAAILTLIGLIDLPIIHYSVNWWNTLHQGSTLLTLSKPKIELSMAYPLYLMICGVMLYCIFVILLKARYKVLLRERRQAWVRDVVNGDIS